MRCLLLIILFLPMGLFGQSQSHVLEYYLDSVDQGQFYWDTTNSQNLIWQYGINQKPFFDGPNTILVTDTVNMYDSSIDASVDLILINSEFNWSYWQQGFVIKFEHKIDTDNEHAGGYFEISLDNDSMEYVHYGDTLKTYWLQYYLPAPSSSNYSSSLFMNNYRFITDQNDTIELSQLGMYDEDCYHEIDGFHDTLFDGNVGFTGTYSGWKPFYTELFWPYGGVKMQDEKDSLIFRFHFKSDSTSNDKNGWAIKNIETGYVVYETGSMVENSENMFSVLPNPVLDRVSIHYSKALTGRFKLVLIDINGRKALTTWVTDKAEIDVSNLSRGLYIYQILDDRNNQVQTGKLIKE